MWTHDESKQHKPSQPEITVVNELVSENNSISGSCDNLEFALGNGKCRNEQEDLKSTSGTGSENSNNIVVSAEVHNESCVNFETGDNTNDCVVENTYRNVNGDCHAGGDKKVRTSNVTYKKSANVSMLIHRHTL